MLDEEDLNLLERSRGGDRQAFGVFVRRHQQLVRRSVRAIVDSDADADDVAQDTFVQVWRALGTDGADKRGASTVRAWLLTIARRAAWRKYRRHVGEPRFTESLDAPAGDDGTSGVDQASVVDWGSLGEAAGWGQNPEARAALAEQRARVQSAMARLGAEEREVLTLRDVLGLSGPEAAAALGVGLAAEKSRLHRARLALLGALGPVDVTAVEVLS
jgi:RNA polymerase sigma-70 factor (ECF subfamily)